MCVRVCVFQGSCRGTRPDLNLFLLSQDLQCPPITLLGAQCILGWVPTPRAARRALTGLKDPSMGTKVRVVCLNGNYLRQLSSLPVQQVKLEDRSSVADPEHLLGCRQTAPRLPAATLVAVRCCWAAGDRD